MNTLDEIALKYGVDKASDGHNYTPVYEQLFGPLRDRPVALLELGVAEGWSLRTWADYFTNPGTVITGIDDLSFYQRYHKRQVAANHPAALTIYYGDQAEIPSALRGWVPDIVIDDASHLSSKTIASFQTWFPVLRPGGIYVVEDVHTSYLEHIPEYGAHECSHDPDKPPPLRPNGQTAMQFLRRLADEVQSFAQPPQYRLGYDIESLCFHRDLVVLRKGSQ